MPLWENDEELFDIINEELFTALVGDVLDKLGYHHQFLSQETKPLTTEMVVVGRAMPVLEADSFGETSNNSRNSIMQKPFGLMFEALDSLKKNEIYICSGASNRYALWGGLMSIRAKKLGAAGAVVNGFSRDTNQILKIDFPTFSIGTYAQDQGVRGKVIDYNTPIEWDGIRIEPGDLIFGDRDGVLVVPQHLVEEAIAKAIEKARGENKVRSALENGLSAVKAYNKFGIL